MKTSQSVFLSWAILILLLALLNPFTIWAQDSNQMEMSPKHFNGFYLGTSLGYQNIFGGAFIDDLDVLAQKSSLVLDYSGGYRLQFLQNNIMIGGEIFYGLTDGHMTEVDPRSQIKVFYENNTQVGIGLQAGIVLGKKDKVLLYLFYNETRRVFDIHFITIDGSRITQKDTQYLDRYGVGLELPVYQRLNLTANIANSHSDFGDLETSMDVNDQLDYNVGILLNF
ncbi:MAG: outer membrane beta-barrel protein [Saprospiraceae bacterium]